MLIYSLYAILEGLIKAKLTAIGGIVGVGYYSWAIGYFFGKDKIINYVKAIFAYILGMITFIFTAILIEIIIDLIVKH